jgi:hypothetical protein
MSPAPLFLTLTILASPAALLFDGPIAYGLVTAAAALLIAIVALRIQPAEADFLRSVIGPLGAIAALPVLWMVLQVLPLGPVGLAHPIWQSAAAALERPVAGSISIDPGATIMSLAQYMSMTAIALVAAAIAVDRRHAKRLLATLTTAATLMALLALAVRFGAIAFPGTSGDGLTGSAAVDGAGLGLILATAVTFQKFEPHENPRRDDDRAMAFWLSVAACIVAAAICALAVATVAGRSYFAVICGAAILAIVALTRRFGVGLWGYAAILSATAVLAIAVVALQSGGSRPKNLAIAFASEAPAPLLAVTGRILTETSLTGTGAGTFAAVLPIYKGADELASGRIAPTFAAALAVEMGQPFLWATLAAAFALVIALLRGALRRGRDSIYPTAGASCVVAVVLMGFGNSGVSATPVSMIVAAALGTAIAQSKSRSVS